MLGAGDEACLGLGMRCAYHHPGMVDYMRNKHLQRAGGKGQL